MYNKYDFIVSKNESDSVKDMILKRVQARSNKISSEIQDDIMTLAHNSFSDKSNPFSFDETISSINQKANNIELQSKNLDKSIEETSQMATPEPVPSDNAEQIGFPIKQGIKQIVQRQEVLTSNFKEKAIVTSMQEAREGLVNRTNFMGALNFLNSQAAVSLFRTQSGKFDIVV